MRIIITGTSGVGKTTLVEMLAPVLSLPIIPELGRKLCTEMGYEKIGDIHDQEEFKRKVLRAQIKVEDQTNSFVSDRSTIDCWVLWQRWNLCQAMTFDTEDYYRLAKQQSEKYSHIIYVPPMFAPPEDGFRWTDPDYQKQVDRLVRMTLYEWNLLERTYVVQSPQNKERLAEVLGWLKQHSPPT
jgi:nicotinamide riboside kinase